MPPRGERGHGLVPCPLHFLSQFVSPHGSIYYSAGRSSSSSLLLLLDPTAVRDQLRKQLWRCLRRRFFASPSSSFLSPDPLGQATFSTTPAVGLWPGRSTCTLCRTLMMTSVGSRRSISTSLARTIASTYCKKNVFFYYSQ